MASFVSESVSVDQSGLHGDGVFARSALAVGNVLFREAPLEKQQSLSNRQAVLVCGACFSFLGDSGTQLDLLAGNTSRYDLVAARSIAGVVPCRDGCGEVYCCEGCEDRHWTTSHRLLCTGHVSDAEAKTHPLMAFKIHACQTNEIFLMVADIFAKICLQVEVGMSPETAMAPYNSFVHELWWDAAAKDRPQLAMTLQQISSESWFLLEKALKLGERGMSLLLSADYFSRTIGMFEQNNVGIRLSNPAGTFAMSILGTSEQEDQERERVMQAVTQICDRQDGEGADCDLLEMEGGEEGEWEDMEDGDEEDEEEDVMGIAAVAAGGGEGEGEGAYPPSFTQILEERGGLDNLFAPLDGAAFYSLVCKINHSCVPNVNVTYENAGPGVGIVACVSAVRGIVPGEELTHSYIDASEPFERRAQALDDYGFKCSCTKCLQRL